MFPLFVGTCDGEMVSGSCRVPPYSSSHLSRALGACKEALSEFGGHAAAAGFRLEKKK